MVERSFGPLPLTPGEARDRAARHARLPDECHWALGFYMGEWSHLELAMGKLTAMILGTEEFLGHLLADKMPPNSVRDILLLAASNYMNSKDYKDFVGICERWKIANGIRNRIVHGQWRVNIFTDTEDKATYTRFSHIWDRETAARESSMFYQNSQSLRDKWSLTADRIIDEGKAARTLGNDIGQFASDRTLRRQPDILADDPRSSAPQPASKTDRPSPVQSIQLNVQNVRGW